MGLGSIAGAIGGALSGTAGLGTALSLGSSAASYLGQKKANEMNRDLSREQMQFQREMSNTAYQRAMDDMREAGLNPILAGKLGGASTPGGSMPVMHSEAGAGVQGGMQGLTTAMDAMKKSAETELTQYKAMTEGMLAPTRESVGNVIDDVVSWGNRQIRDGIDWKEVKKGVAEKIENVKKFAEANSIPVSSMIEGISQKAGEVGDWILENMGGKR